MTPRDRVLARLKGVIKTEHEARARCPAHDDKNRSLSVGIGKQGQVLLKCFAGCEVPAIVKALGLEMKDLFPVLLEGARPLGPFPMASHKRLTLEALAAHKKLPVEFLKGLGLRERKGRVEIPYFDESGREVATRLRTAFKAGEGSSWPRGTKLIPYGLNRLGEARQKGALVLVEGESDVWTLWYHGHAVLGIPGASAAKCLEPAHVKGIPWLYVWREPDGGGETFVCGLSRRFKEIEFQGKVLVLELTSAKDPSAFHIDVGGDHAKFEAGMGVVVRASRPLDQVLGGLGPERVPADGSANGRAEHAEIPTANSRALGEQGNDTGQEAESDLAESYLPFEEFPVDALPPVARAYVREAAKAQGVSPTYFAVPLLTLSAGVIGTSRCVVLKRGYRELPIIWAALVARSGSGKSPALAACLRLLEPLRKRLRTTYEREFEEYKKLVGDSKKAQGRAGTSELRDDPKEGRVLVGDATFEGVVPILDENRRGLILWADELASWLDFDRYSGGGKKVGASRWLPLWAGELVDYDRRGCGSGAGQHRTHIYIPRAALSVVGGIPPETLRAVLSNERLADGLVARVCFACPPDPMAPWTEDTISEGVEREMRLRLEELYALEPEPTDEGERPRDLTLTPEAQEIWAVRHDELVKESPDESDTIQAAASKSRAYAARFALILTLLEDPRASTVSAPAMEAGWKIARWFLREHRRVLGRLAERTQTRAVRRLVELLQRLGGRATVRDLVRGSSRYRRSGGADQCRRDAESAVAAVAARWAVATHPGAGRPTAVIELITRGDGDTINELRGENDNSVTVTNRNECAEPTDGREVIA